MRKILAFLSVFTICTPFASIVSACKEENPGATDPDSKFNVWDLSTWGNAQKDIINKAYIDAVKSWYSITNPNYNLWSAWNSNDQRTLQTALNKINTKLNLNNGGNATWVYFPVPGNKDNVNNLFNKGLNLYVKGINSDVTGISGNFNMEINGGVQPSFNKEDLNSWGAAQTTIISQAYLASAKTWYDQQSPLNRSWYDWRTAYDPAGRMNFSNEAVVNAVKKINSKFNFQ